MNRPLRIVVADDEEDIRDYFAKVLARQGHFVLGTVEDGQQLVDICKRSTPDVIITDVRMPRLSGVEAVLRIRKTNFVPAIFISAFDEAETAAASIPDGWTYLHKPINRTDLYRALAWAAALLEGTRPQPE